MAQQDQAIAYPSKRFFIYLLTRDITAEGAVLDLIDNAANCALRSMGFDANRMRSLISGGAIPRHRERSIDVVFNQQNFVIRDNCGGIDIGAARKNVFRFGRDDDAEQPQTGDLLSVYGVGLKRAIFKLGRRATVVSQHGNTAFEVDINIDSWLKQRGHDWAFPLREIRPSDAGLRGGTSITVTRLYPEIIEKTRASIQGGTLSRRISEAYGFFERLITIRVNREAVPGKKLIASDSAQTDSFDAEGCHVEIVAALAAPTNRSEWRAENAGWYVLCNGRAVVSADKTSRTGWTTLMPSFVSKFRGFIGIVLFTADDPERLPWTTTKTDVNQESAIYQLALPRMRIAAKPVLDYLNSIYSSDEVDMETGRQAAASVVARSVDQLVSVHKEFARPAIRTPRPIRVQFDATIGEIESIQDKLKRKSSAGRIGRMCFDYYLKNEIGK